MPAGSPSVPRNATDRRFLLRPRWLALHVFALAGLAVMITAGFWQLDRLDQRQAANARLAERSSQPVAAIDDLLDAGSTPVDADAVTSRIAAATGSFDPTGEVFVRNRTLDGRPGAWVLTPLVLDDGSAVMVLRGWIPSSGTTPTLPTGAEAPNGRTTVTGLVVAGQTRGRIGPTDPSEGRLDVFARADLGRIGAQYAPPLLPVYLQVLPAAGPPTGALPVPVPAPEMSEGPHRGYAGQWFAFAAVWVIGYPLAVRRAARRLRRSTGAASSADLVVLHAVRIGGVATTGAIAQRSGVDVDRAGAILAAAADAGFVRFATGRLEGWVQTPEGRVEVERRLAVELDACGGRDEVAAAHRAFLELNPRMLAACTDWQLRADGVRNDHTDAAWDAAAVGRLIELDAAIRPVCSRLTAVLDRFSTYAPRFTAALDRVRAGEVDWFTRPTLSSYHQVWFELHEDLLATLGIDRSSERSTEPGTPSA